MNTLEHVASLRRLGYNERQARFLRLVARHGGYFLRRQYAAFAGRAHGPGVSEFLQNAVTRGHVVRAPLDGHVHVYHVRHTALYRVMGQGDSRSRRRHGDLRSIRRRVMTVDFVLSHPTLTFLVTDKEHREVFVDGLHVPAAIFPIAPASPSQTWQLVIGVAADRARIMCAYVDDADRKGGSFERNLRRVAPLCQCLSQPIDIVFATPIEGQQPLAERVFARVFGDPTKVPSTRGALAAEIAAYVRVRHRIETGDLGGATQQELDAMREIFRRPAKALADMWYRRWIDGGDAAIHAMLGAVSGLTDEPRLRLVVQHLPFGYRALGLWIGGPC